MKVINKQDSSGRLVYSSEIIRDIVSCALCEVDGVVMYNNKSKQHRDCIKVEQSALGVFVDVFVKIKYNCEVSDVASSIQNTIKETIESMTEFKVCDVNVHVCDVEFDEA